MSRLLFVSLARSRKVKHRYTVLHKEGIKNDNKIHSRIIINE